MAGRAGWVRWAFFVLNILFTVTGACLLGFIVYSVASMPDLHGILDGTFLFSYAVMGLSLVMVITGIFGNFASLTENICSLKGISKTNMAILLTSGFFLTAPWTTSEQKLQYIVFMVLLIFLEIAVVIATYVFKDKIPTIIESAWDSFSTETRDLIQQDLKCCAFENSTEYSTIPESCYTTTGVLFQNACDDEMTAWIESNTTTWTGALGSVAGLQLVCGVLCCMVMARINEKMRTEPDPRELASNVPPPEPPKKKMLQPKTFGKAMR